MILFFSDLHLGRTDGAPCREAERALVACLRQYADRAEALFLVGDVFDAYIEYPTLVPKGFARLQGLLAEWTDRGVPVVYLAGNHDPWHGDYYRRELGVRVVAEEHVEPLYGHTVYLAHGDRFARSARLYTLLRPLLRHPVPVWLYRTLLPADLGFRLARRVSRVLADEVVDAEKVAELRDHARGVLASTGADLVVMGHCHHPELSALPGGHYLNLGTWFDDRTFGLLDADGPRLMRWNEDCADTVAAAGASASRVADLQP